MTLVDKLRETFTDKIITLLITAALTFSATAFWMSQSMQGQYVSKEFYQQDQKQLQTLQQKQFDFISQQLSEIKDDLKEIKKR